VIGMCNELVIVADQRSRPTLYKSSPLTFPLGRPISLVSQL